MDDTPHAPAPYIHGYGDDERERLDVQAGAIVDLLHGDVVFPRGSRVLEVGCGTGAQTVTLARRSPGARFLSVDRSPASLGHAMRRVAQAGLDNVEWLRADLFALPLPAASFDHVFVCFVLEHLPRPVEALRVLRDLVKPGGTITVFEGDHGSAYFHPDGAAARRVIACQVDLQVRDGGNPCIGRTLFPLLRQAGFADVRVTPRCVYVDAARPALVEAFTRRTFIGMVESVRARALASGMVDAAAFERGLRELHRITEDDGVFCYSFFKGVAARPR
jgi:SAM-dependent methyltransferase